ncbi:hypothetical protein ACA910_011812 [Epithemia clementina (nom. ined.)]
MAEIAAKGAIERIIAHGGSALPRQKSQLEREQTANFRRTFTSSHFDPSALEAEIAITNIWTDMEKCIFLDRFMHHPKDFRKIASFLRNKSTKDCVTFYYDLKQTVPYKTALKEFILRRNRRGEYNVWDATMQAAVSVGAVVRAGLDEQRPLVFTLPNHENSFATSSLHPIRSACIDDIVVDEKRILEGIDSRHGEEGLESNHSQHLSKRPREPLFVVDPRATKYLKTSAPESTPEPTNEPAQEPEALPKESAEQI